LIQERIAPTRGPQAPLWLTWARLRSGEWEVFAGVWQRAVHMAGSL